MGQYLIPIKTALYIFPIVALVISLPFLIYQYRKYGYFNKLRALVIYSFILFLMCSYFLIILPLPKSRDVASLQRSGTKHYQLAPFQFIRDIINESEVEINNPISYITLLKERAFYQALFNFFLLMPLGVYLRYHFKRNLKQTILITFITSLFFEITQLTALYGYYNAPYRLFDVDDLILNTCGGTLGYFLAQYIIANLPHVSDIDNAFNPQESVVSVLRRAIAFSVDFLIIWLILLIPSIIFNIIIKEALIEIVNMVATLIVWFIYFLVLPIKKDGKTFGKDLVRIKLQQEDYLLLKKNLIIRYTVLYMMFYGINNLLKIINMLINLGEIFSLLINILSIIYNFSLIIYIGVKTFSKDKLFLHDKLSKIKNVVNM